MQRLRALNHLLQRRVISTAWRMLGNEEDARDAAQEVFFRTYKYLSKYKAEQDFYGWLYRIIVNACHDIARKRTRSAHFSLLKPNARWEP